MRRHRTGIVALVLVAVGVVLVLLAVDTRTWQRTVTRDDMRFRTQPSHRDLWSPQTVLPGDPAGALLGTGDTLATRRTLQNFWFSRLGADPETDNDLPTIRAKTQNGLTKLMRSGVSATERSAAANLLGVLTVTSPPPGTARTGLGQVLKRAAGYFQHAIALDSANGDAKENLELVLRVVQPGRGRLGQDARAGYGLGRGRGATQTGSGY